MFKKIRLFVLLICVLLIAALCGCTESEGTEVPVGENTEVSADIQETPEAEPIVDEPEPEEAEEPTEIEEEPVEEPAPEAEAQPEQEVEEPVQEPEESPVENKPVEQAPSSESSSSSSSTTDPNSPNFDPYNRPGYVYIPGFGYIPDEGPNHTEDTGIDFWETLENSPQVGTIG